MFYILIYNMFFSEVHLIDNKPFYLVKFMFYILIYNMFFSEVNLIDNKPFY